VASESLTAADIEIMRVDIASETANLFLQLMAYQSRLTNSTEAVELAQRTVQAVQERVGAGLSPQADLERARAELAFAELNLEDIRHELKTARYQLAAQWGSTQLDFETARGDPLLLPSIAPLQDLNQLALQNPLFQRYLTQQRLDEAELRLAEAQRKPGWRGTVGVRRYESTDDFALVTGLTLPLAIRNRNQGNIAAAHAAAEQTFAETAAAKVRVETTLLVLYEALQHSLHVALTLRDEVLPLIESALVETQAAYDQGRYGYFDLRSVQAEFIAAKNAQIEASIAAHSNVIEIERLTGTRLAHAGKTP
jgi:cobalt-zinc-cadmium efflux system outer membrane protein